MIYALTTKLLAHSTFLILSIRRRLKLWIRVRILKEHIYFEVLKKTDVLGSRVAILALYPRPGLKMSTLRQVKLFKDQNISVVCVVNKSGFEHEIIESLEKLDVTVLLRSNIGRDFGAYQAGYRFLQPIIQSLTSLFLINDSAYYFRRTRLELLESFPNASDDWATLFINYEYHLHAQSFFLAFGKDIILNPEFQEFWRNYYPSNERRHVVDRGEVRLSQLLMKCGFTPRAFVNSQTVLNVTRKWPMRNFEMRALYGAPFGKVLERDFKYPGFERWRDDVGWFTNTRNATHETGSYFARCLKLPLKLDLVRSGIIPMTSILAESKSLGLEEGEDIELIDAFLRNGSVTTRKGLDRIWVRYGLI